MKASKLFLHRTDFKLYIAKTSVTYSMRKRVNFLMYDQILQMLSEDGLEENLLNNQFYIMVT